MTFSLAGFIEGLVYSAVSTAGGAVGVSSPLWGVAISAFANLFQTAFESAAVSNPSLQNPLTVGVSTLYKTLQQEFGLIVSTVGQQEQTLLSDWGMMQAVYPYTVAGNELSWPSEVNSLLVSQLTPGFTAQFMQLLLSSSYQIDMQLLSEVEGFSDSSCDNLPPYAYYTWYVNLANFGPFFSQGQGAAGLFLANNYKIGSIKDACTVPGQQALNDLFNNGILPNDFFTGSNGWLNAPNHVDVSADAPGAFLNAAGCNGEVMTIQNLTPETFTIKAEGNSYQIWNCGPGSQGACQHNSGTLFPYATIQVAYQTGSYPVTLTFTDGNNNQVTLVRQRHDCQAQGSTTFSSSVYYHTPPYIGMGNNSPGVFQAGIYNPNALQ